MSKPCYYLAPTRTNPPEGVIRLGSIVASPSLVDEPIHTTASATPDPTSVTTHTERNWSKSITASNRGRVGIWASFLQLIVGVGGDVGVSIANDTSQNYSANVMKWSEFRPSLAYLRNAVKEEEVDEFIRGNRFREKVYMVTGIMIASGASGVVQRMRERGIYAHVGVDATVFSGGMAPVAIGPDFKLTQSTRECEAFSNADEFVFAFRLRQIKVKKTGEVTHKAKVDGALFGVGDDEEQLRRREEEERQVGVMVVGLEDGDAGAEEFRLDDLVVRHAVDEEGRECKCIEIAE
jgi:hypothetical protein